MPYVLYEVEEKRHHSGDVVEVHHVNEFHSLYGVGVVVDALRAGGDLQRKHCTPCLLYLIIRARFRHVEAPGQPSVVELWRPTLP